MVKLRFGGVTSSFYELCEKLKISDKSTIMVVDKSTIRQGANIFGGKVQPPNVIKNDEIKCVIVAVPQYYSNLAPTIRNEYPGVERLLNITEILSCDFA